MVSTVAIILTVVLFLVLAALIGVLIWEFTKSDNSSGCTGATCATGGNTGNGGNTGDGGDNNGGNNGSQSSVPANTPDPTKNCTPTIVGKCRKSWMDTSKGGIHRNKEASGGIQWVMSPTGCSDNFTINIVPESGSGTDYTADYSTGTKPWIAKTVTDPTDPYYENTIYSFAIQNRDQPVGADLFKNDTIWTVTPKVISGSTLTANPLKYKLSGDTKYNCGSEQGEANAGFNCFNTGC